MSRRTHFAAGGFGCGVAAKSQRKRSRPVPAGRWRRLGETARLAGKDFLVDDGLTWAAAIAFYSLFSLFPLLLVGVSVAALLVDAGWAAAEIAYRIGEYLPTGEREIRRIVRHAHEAGAGAGLLSLGVLLWTGSYVFGAITSALNRAHDATERYGLLKRLTLRLLMLLTIGVLLLLALSAGFLLDVLANVLRLLPVEERGWTFRTIRSLVPALLLLASLYLLYRFVPRRHPQWQAALVGASVATVLFSLAQPVFAYYIQRFGENMNVIYGSISIGITLMFWAWIAAVILLFGGELSSHVQALVIDGESTTEVEKRHRRYSPEKAKAA